MQIYATSNDVSMSDGCETAPMIMGRSEKGLIDDWVAAIASGRDAVTASHAAARFWTLD